MRSFIHILLAFASFIFAVRAEWWLQDIAHQGLAPSAESGYAVFRNVQDYGAKGDGVTDDTAAINAAITAGSRCGQGCDSTTATPAIVYFPSGTYLISSSLLPDYFTQIIGDATDPPTLKASAGMTGFGLIDANPYYSSDLNWVSTNVFYTSVRNLIIDTTNVAATTACTGIHWPVSQATSLQNVVFNMPTTAGVVHVGIFMESGSGGFISDVTFNGGAYGAQFGNQQYTMRNLEFNNQATAAIQMLWDWDWTFINLTVNNVPLGIDMSAGGSSDQEVGSVIVIDSTFSSVDVAIKTAYDTASTSVTNGSLVLENVVLTNSPVAVQDDEDTVLAGGGTVSAFVQGHTYTLTSGPTDTMGTVTANSRPAALLGSGSNYYTQSKPQYETLTSADFVSVRTSGAVGNGVADDTAAIQSAINSAVAAGKVVFIDYGLYRITSTISIPPGTKIVGETFPVLMAAGAYFEDINTPQVMLQIGTAGEAGTVALSDIIVSTQGAMAGAILIEYNLKAPAGTPSGFWDVHARIGGFDGSQLQVAQCLKDPGSSTVVAACIAAYMALHATAQSGGLYLENTWFWAADHDIDDASDTQITVYSGRGMFIESTTGPFWLVGTAVEHHVLYQYQFADTTNIFASQLQTETPYFQPLPNALVPFTANATLQDPTFDCDGVSGNCDEAWGLRILSSSDIFIYGANHYSWFNNYEQDCSTFATNENCQARIIRLQGTLSNINMYSVNTIGSTSMIDNDGTEVASWADNKGVYQSNIISFKSG
ncbi:exo-beta-1,3-glucanase-like protein [Coniella lustricola]|uniref:Exo-beta-1,3-glucanase-like protein n=1 Tax=Coniella lustricola TaxID=2025994 RepID=A0A2T3ALX4_9PEZI|nr:exo-beta-1,3-glucanase-like protein [Coniella lustricola]